MQAQSDGPLCHRGPKQSVSPLKPIVPPCSASGTRPYMFTSWHTYLTFGDVHLRLHTSRPSRGALMRRHEGGAGPAPAGVVRSCTPGRTPEQPRRLLWAARVRAPWNAKAGKAGGALDRRVFFFRVCSGAPHPLVWGNGKRDGPTPSPTKPGAAQTRLFDS